MLNHKYLKCALCGAEIEDDGLVTAHGCPALLRAKYTDTSFNPGADQMGLFKFSKWLPVNRILQGSSAPVTYQSKALANELGLNNLFVTYSGYWEEKRALMDTCTFKECEAYAVLARFPENAGKVLVVASAGNTARAFIKVAGKNNIPLVVVIPEENLDSLWGGEKADCVRVVAAGNGSDYADAINIAGMLCETPGFVNEGGAKNVARRDGMGTVMLSAALFIGEAPDYYFQAIGSGTGAIAAWEANLRLLEGGFAKKTASLQLSQNAPFLPIYEAWKARSPNLFTQDELEAREQISQIAARVLSNRAPPYAIKGGLYDALVASSGGLWSVTNNEIASAQALFCRLEGCDICPEAGAALASLIQAVAAGKIKRDDAVCLNITGGGFNAAKAKAKPIEADMVVNPADIRERHKLESLIHDLAL